MTSACYGHIASSTRQRSGVTSGSLYHALGLTLVRLRRADEPLDELRQAAELDHSQARYTYVCAVALHSAGRVGEAMTELKEGLARHPGDRDTLLALINFSREGGDASAASNTLSSWPKSHHRTAD